MSDYEESVLEIESITNEIMDTTMVAREKHGLGTCDAACTRAIVEKALREAKAPQWQPPETMARNGRAWLALGSGECDVISVHPGQVDRDDCYYDGGMCPRSDLRGWMEYEPPEFIKPPEKP